MIGTQERRMSLRRKRSTKGTDATESPVSKKSSPLMENVDDETSGNSVQSQVYEFQRINSQLLLSPRQSFRTPKIDQKRRLSDNTKQTFHTPQTRQQELESQQQHSPDTPFICSQLHGTQECEVVWDCNSPGYSKDDLKRMPGGDAVETSTGDCPVAFVTPAPHRVLFPRVRSRPQCSSFNKNTTAQLDELLDQLSSKGKKPGKGKVLHPLSHSKNNNAITEETSLSSEEDSSPCPSSPPCVLSDTSSQPFNKHDKTVQDEEQLVAPAVKDINLISDVDDSLWSDELNMGICDISGINIVCDTDIRQSVREKVEVTANESDKDSVIDKVKVDTILSADIFDDDLFNESVIRTTQAMEEALTDIDESNVLSSVTEERCVKVSEILFENFQEHHESEKSALQSLSGVKVIGAGQKNSLEEQCKPNDNFSDIVDGKASNRPFKNVTDTIYKSHSATYHDNKQKPCQSIKNSNNEGKIITFGDQSRSNTSHIIKNHSISGGESSCTPILAKTCSSLINNSHRQSRKSFRLESNPQTCSRTKTDKISLVLNVKSSTDSESKSVQSSKNHKLNKGSVNSSVHFTLSSLPSSSPLLRNSECNNESARLTNKGQTMRGLLLRSHSTSNAKISGGDVSSAVQRSKSSIAGDFSREFEDDDEFFESLVSHLPEDGEELIKNTHFQQGTTGCIPKCRKVAAARCKPKFSFKDSSLQSFRDNQEDNKEVVQEKMLQVVSGTTLETPNLSESFVGGRRNQRSFIHSKQAMTSCPQNSKPCNNKLPSVNMERSLDSQLEEDEQGDSKACHHVSTKTTRRASEILDDDLFEDDVLSIIDEVEYSQLEEDEQGDSKACHHVSTKTTRRASEILDDDLFEDDVLSVIDEVESQYGSQQAQSEMASSQPLICTKDEITRKKEAAQRLREEKQRGRNQLGRYRPVY